MSEKEGILRMQSSGRRAVCRPHDPVEIMSGELFRIEVNGELRVTRMDHLYGEGYFSIDGYPCATAYARRSGPGIDAMPEKKNHTISCSAFFRPRHLRPPTLTAGARSNATSSGCRTA
jgi:hypothetical protein